MLSPTSLKWDLLTWAALTCCLGRVANACFPLVGGTKDATVLQAPRVASGQTTREKTHPRLGPRLQHRERLMPAPSLCSCILGTLSRPWVKLPVTRHTRGTPVLASVFWGSARPHAHSGITRRTQGTQHRVYSWLRFITVKGYMTGPTRGKATGRVWRLLTPCPTSQETHKCTPLSRSEKFI